jgi:uncharacterized HAD superfamily protein
VTTEKEAIQRVHNFFDTEEFKNAKPFGNAQDALLKLSHRYKLVIVTARDTIIEQVTREWLDRHFQELVSSIHFTAQYNLDGLARSKAEVIKAIGATYLIDDAPDHISEAAKAGVHCVLFGVYPWNKNVQVSADVVRCADWQAVLEYFDGIS